MPHQQQFGSQTQSIRHHNWPAKYGLPAASSIACPFHHQSEQVSLPYQNEPPPLPQYQYPFRYCQEAWVIVEFCDTRNLRKSNICRQEQCILTCNNTGQIKEEWKKISSGSNNKSHPKTTKTKCAGGSAKNQCDQYPAHLSGVSGYNDLHSNPPPPAVRP